MGGSPFDAVCVPHVVRNIRERAGVGYVRSAFHALEDRHDHAPCQWEVLAELGFAHAVHDVIFIDVPDIILLL